MDIRSVRYGRRVAQLALDAVLFLGLLGCATNAPLRDAELAWNGSTAFARPAVCDASYAATDDLIWNELRNPASTVGTRAELDLQVAQIISPLLDSGNEQLSGCWRTSYENHQRLSRSRVAGSGAPGYDLLLAEFDDQGERTDVSVGHVAFERSEVALIESRLNALLTEELRKDPRGGLNVVVLTHGWHGNAAASGDYSIWFKAILEEIAKLEMTSRRSVCASGQRRLGVPADPAQKAALRAQMASYACSLVRPANQDGYPVRRTVGIEVAWRGDSETIPLLTWANFWDRKGAAQTVAQGAVHDLFARLHAFYMAHSCHGTSATRTPGGQSCDAVHLLTIGHSFGALIDYHLLNNDFASGLLGDRLERAYGFGDITVLLNPAFEGEREITLEEAALYRGAYPAHLMNLGAAQKGHLPQWPSGAQMPILVTLQSKGDKATHYLFPLARIFTGLFENTPGAGEYPRSLRASGWIGSYQTHLLTEGRPNTKDDCDHSGGGPMWFCPFDPPHEENQDHPLVLKWQGTADQPAYFPLWTVSVDKAVMNDHDDISNPLIIRFVAQMFRAAYEQSELIHEIARRSHLQQPRWQL